MMNEEVINVGIKGFEDSIRESCNAPSYKPMEHTRKAIERAIIWAVTQYIMNTTDQFKGFVVSSGQTQSPKCEVNEKQGSQYGKKITFPNPVAFYKGRWYWDFYELLDIKGFETRLNRPVISEEHGKQLYRSV